MFLLVKSEELALLLNATVLTISVSSAITYRNSAMPRTAIIAILLATLPYLAGCFDILGGQYWVVIVIAVPLLFSSYALTVQNHDILIRLIGAEWQARALAYTDALTGLPNRLSFILHQETLKSRSDVKGGYAYMCLDLDGFKQVNDRHGHPAGDLLLKTVALRMKEVTRKDDVVFRIGGDEFIVYMPNAHPEDCKAVAGRIIERMNDPFVITEKLNVWIGCSAGSACFDSATDTSESILAAADVSLYKAKQEGKGRHVHSTHD